MNPTPPYHGSCLCGSIRYSAGTLSPKMGHCHCTMCRKFHGAAYATFGETPVSEFHWLQGEELLQSYRADNGTVRKFCSRCGSSLIFEPSGDGHDVVEFALATLDQPIDARPDAHIFTNYKADWSSICDGLPSYGEGRGE